MGGKVSTDKMAAVGRVVQAVRPRVPLIKFPDRQSFPKPDAQEALKLLAVSNQQTTVPSGLPSATPSAPRPAPALSRLPGTPDSISIVKELPQRYRRRELALEEMDYIQRGGPE